MSYSPYPHLFQSTTTGSTFVNSIYAPPGFVSPTPFPNPMLKFDPNEKHKPPEFATYAPNRRPQWKLHATVGHAKNAFSMKRDILMFQWIQGQWVEIARQEGELSPTCQECGANLLKESRYRPGSCHHKGSTIWDPRKKLQRITLCRGCTDRIGK